jgi:hypothetical protein
MRRSQALDRKSSLQTGQYISHEARSGELILNFIFEYAVRSRMPNLNDYLYKLTHLKRGITMYGLAPHKPILLITLLELINNGHITANVNNLVCPENEKPLK